MGSNKKAKKRKKDKKKAAQTDNDAQTDIVTMFMGALNIGGKEKKQSPSKTSSKKLPTLAPPTDIDKKGNKNGKKKEPPKHRDRGTDGKRLPTPPPAKQQPSPSVKSGSHGNIDDGVLIWISEDDEQKGPTIKRETPTVKSHFDVTEYTDEVKHFVKRETPVKPNLDKEMLGALKVKQQKRTTLPDHIHKDKKMYKKRVTLSYSHLAVPWHKTTQKDSDETISSLKDPEEVNWGLGRRFALQQAIQSQHIKPMRFVYKQFYQGRCWDAVLCKDVVHAVIFNSTRKKLIFVKQFRPAVYFESVKILKPKKPKIGDVLEIYDIPANLGVTLELCMGVMNKHGTTPIEAIRRKIYYDCGYAVPLTCLEKVQWCYNNSRNSAEKTFLYYAEVTDKMLIEDTDKLIEIRRRKKVKEMSVKEAIEFAQGDETILMTTYSTLYGILWFLYAKGPSISHKDSATKRLFKQVSSFFGKVGKLLRGK